MKDLIATYRLQLRNGVDFGTATALVAPLADLGFSHLYLSPIFTAQPGSTHGYDITDPAEIDPVLGGEDGYRRLAAEANKRGLGLILDIVPNHTAFSVDNLWLRDVLRFGQDSRFADYFDIDWTQRLVLPWLPEPFETLLEKDKITVRNGHMVVGDLSVPIADDTVGMAIGAAHDAQAWRLTHWMHERDGVTHRRFFSISGLIGMRVEQDHIFDAMHSKVFDLIANGEAHGLRIDHIDGLVDPDGYLRRLKDKIGDIPVWVEKILTGHEALPTSWPVEGTTGYEAARQISRVLTHPQGHARLRAAWSKQTGDDRTFSAAVHAAKIEVITGELAAELHQLIALAQDVFDAEKSEMGPETIRETVIALLVHLPRYRTYLTPDNSVQGDVDLLNKVVEQASGTVANRAPLDILQQAMVTAGTPAARHFQNRFQQVTGALIAKSHEDTAAFRHTAYLAACEVGADPDDALISSAVMQDWCSQRSKRALTLTSSHDTKRSEDARMRLVAMSHCPDDALALVERARVLSQDKNVDARHRWYVVQAALAIWKPANDDLDQRLRDHLRKAMREAGLLTNWIDPDEKAEADVLDFAQAVLDDWRDQPIVALDRIITTAEHLSLAQVVLRMLLPGVPDIYQSCLWSDLSLTDPDNRRPVSFDLIENGPEKDGFSKAKYRLTCALLALRRNEPEVFLKGEVIWAHDETGFIMTRHHRGTEIVTRVNYPDRRCDVTVNGIAVAL